MLPFETTDTFRSNLKVLRVNAGLSTTQLAEKLGWKRDRILDLEYGKGRGRAKLEELVKIAEVFHVSLDQLLTKRCRVVFD